MSDAGLLVADAVVVGGGLAGLWAVLYLPDDWDVLVVDKERGQDLGSSPWAQGGMAVSTHPGDSPELHGADTVRAGAGLCRPEAVDVLTHEAPAARDTLVQMGCAFDRAPDGSFDLNREAGQTVARSVHAADATGREIMRVVVEAARRRARRIVGDATRLLVADGRCAGVAVRTAQGDLDVVGRATLLAAGGCGALYHKTTNPAAATGDGLALAYEAGAEVSDCEFVQFHPTALAAGSLGPTALAAGSLGPTALAAGGTRRVLLTEALRGEGAIVVDEAGKRFLFDVHPEGELAPRDVVARAIAERGSAFLDARPIGAERVRQRFPTITAAVAEAGFDLTSGLVPIEPAAHYSLGGVSTDTHGRTTLPGLYAAGECAATGVHGANRMAGNSLSEAVVFGRRAAIAMAAEAPRGAPPAPAAPDVETVRPLVVSSPGVLRAAMTEGAGLVRSEASLLEAKRVADEVARVGGVTMRPSAVAAGLICRCALARTESRGTHFRSDAPDTDPSWEGRHVALLGSHHGKGDP